MTIIYFSYQVHATAPVVEYRVVVHTARLYTVEELTKDEVGDPKWDRLGHDDSFRQTAAAISMGALVRGEYERNAQGNRESVRLIGTFTMED